MLKGNVVVMEVPKSSSSSSPHHSTNNDNNDATLAAKSVKKRVNGISIAGIAVIVSALVSLWASTMIPVWASIVFADYIISIVLASYIILAIGAGLLALGIIITVPRNKNRGRKEGILRLLSYVKPNWPYMLGLGVTLLASTLLSLLQPWVIGFLLINQVITNKDLNSLSWVVGLLLLAYVGKQAASYFNTSFTEILSQKTVHKLRYDLYQHIERLQIEFFDNSRTGELVSRVISDTDQVEKVMTDSMSSIAIDIAMVIGTVGLLLYVNMPLALLVMPITAAIAVAVNLFKKRIKPSSRRIREIVGELAAKTYETIAGIRTVKSFSMEDAEAKRFHQQSLKILKAKVKLARISWAYQTSVELLTALATIIVIVYATPAIVYQSMALGALIAFLGYTDKLFKSISSISKANFDIQKAVAAAERIFEIIDTEPETKVEEEKTKADYINGLRTIKGDIEFQNVSFGYYSERPILNNINLKINGGESIAIVGHSGAGKSTMVSLLLRFYEPNSGTITIDGYPLNRWKLDSLRKRIAVVPQDAILFSESVRDNIAYANIDASDDEIVKAAKAANAHDFIMALPDGYNTNIGERGVKLSQGQRQRIAIARALLKSPVVIIFDEATSNVDSQSEALIQDAIKNLTKGKTTIVIAHRLSTIMNASRIIVLENGRIVETGTHQQLVVNKGTYTNLYETQLR